MAVQLPEVDLQHVRQGIDECIRKAIYFYIMMKAKKPTASFHETDRYRNTAIAFYDAAYTVMMSQGILYNEYIDKDDWIALRKLKNGKD